MAPMPTAAVGERTIGVLEFFRNQQTDASTRWPQNVSIETRARRSRAPDIERTRLQDALRHQATIDYALTGVHAPRDSGRAGDRAPARCARPDRCSCWRCSCC